MAETDRKNLLFEFVAHPVAMNILMVVFLVVGGYVISRINIQFFPDLSLEIATVRVVWPGASAEDVERSITNRLELELKNLDNLKDMTSTSSYGRSMIRLDFFPGTDITAATDDVKTTVDRLIPDLPAEAERPIVSEIIDYEPIASLILTGSSIEQLVILGNQFKDELLARGIGKIEIIGLPDEQILVQIPGQTLRDLGLTLNQIGERIRSHSFDTSIGIFGRTDAGRELRIIDQRRSELSFEDVPIIADADGRFVVLSDVATIQRQPEADQVTLTYNESPSIILYLQRQTSNDTLESANAMYDWLDETRPVLPAGVKIFVFDDASIALRDRIKVLLENGAMGLVLVLIVLYLFLNVRVGIWVAAGIPVSLMAAVTALYLFGGSLNMITLFAFIMTIGIIVDDAIVVAEESLTNYVAEPTPIEAVYRASRRMILPILAASLTTILAFLPVIVVEGLIGDFLGNIALVVMCVVAASLIEAFLILPGHLRDAYERISRKGFILKTSFFDRWFTQFRESWYKRMLTLVISNPLATIAIGIACLILTVGLVASGRLNYSFFPTPELNAVWVNATFSAGTPEETVDNYLKTVHDALYNTEKELGGNLISTSFILHGANSQISPGQVSSRGPNLGSVAVELVQSDTRTVRTSTFLRHWRNQLEYVPGLENIVALSANAGPPGRDIEVRLSGGSKFETKDAALSLAVFLEKIPGVYGVSDNTNFGRQQQILTLTPLGYSLGLTTSEVSRQLRSAIDGLQVQSFTTQYQDIEVNLSLPKEERNRLSELENLYITLPSGESVPLLDVVIIDSARGFDTLSHSMGEFHIEVAASVDATVANLNQILQQLETEVKPQITQNYGVDWQIGSRQADQEKTEQSMRNGALIALFLIYLTLAWIFGSYSWPLFVMLAIPFGIVGAAWGHWLLGLPITIISILGLIGLSGIVVNNAIVLVVFYRDNLQQFGDHRRAMIEAGCQRLRPVVLASLTTIVGLLPLLFETSTQAQFLIPMAATLIFGLGFSSLLVLFFIPAVLILYESIAIRLRKQDGPASGTQNMESV